MSYHKHGPTGSQIALASSTANVKALLDFPTGDVVGTTDTQTLTNKTIDAASNTILNVGSTELDLTDTYDFSSGTLQVGTPSANSDVANKSYVDSNVSANPTVEVIDSGNYTPEMHVNPKIYLVDTSTNAITANFPTAVGNTGKSFIFKMTDYVNTLTLTPNASETIEAPSPDFHTGSSTRFLSDGANWIIV